MKLVKIPFKLIPTDNRDDAQWEKMTHIFELRERHRIPMVLRVRTSSQTYFLPPRDSMVVYPFRVGAMLSDIYLKRDWGRSVTRSRKFIVQEIIVRASDEAIFKVAMA